MKQLQGYKCISCNSNSKLPPSYPQIRLTKTCLDQLAKPSFKDGQAWFEMDTAWYLYQLLGTGNDSPPGSSPWARDTLGVTWSLDSSCQCTKQWSEKRHLWYGRRAPERYLEEASCLKTAEPVQGKESPVNVHTPAHGRQESELCCWLRLVCWNSRRGRWYPPCLSHSLAIIPTTPSFKSFQIIVRYLPGKEEKTICSEPCWSPKQDQQLQ